MTPLERLKELNEKATPGPWESRAHEGIDEGCRCMSCWHTDGGDIDSLHGNNSLTRKCKHCSEMILNKEDADVIAATRNLLPELLALWEAVNELSITRGEFMGENVWGIEDVIELRGKLNARAEDIMK